VANPEPDPFCFFFFFLGLGVSSSSSSSSSTGGGACFFWGWLRSQNLLLNDNKAFFAFGADDFFARCWRITQLQFGETIGTLDRIKIRFGTITRHNKSN
jgi:hypothetical protein